MVLSPESWFFSSRSSALFYVTTKHHPGHDEHLWLTMGLFKFVCCVERWEKSSSWTFSLRTWLSRGVWTRTEFWGGWWWPWGQMFGAAAQPLLLLAQRHHFVAKLLIWWPTYKAAVHIFCFNVGLYFMSIKNKRHTNSFTPMTYAVSSNKEKHAEVNKGKWEGQNKHLLFCFQGLSISNHVPWISWLWLSGSQLLPSSLIDLVDHSISQFTHQLWK